MRICAGAIAAGVALGAGPGCAGEAGDPLGQLALSVVGGVPSAEDRDAVVLIVRDGFEWCTATVVAPTLLLAAGQCLQDVELGSNFSLRCDEDGRGTPVNGTFDASSFQVFVGKDRSFHSMAAARGVAIHSAGQVDLCSNDLGLLEIEPPLLMVEPLPLGLTTAPAVGEKGTLVGWGSPDADELTPYQRRQREVTVLSIGPDVHVLANGATRTVTGNSFATAEGGCQGDAGAPLLALDTGAIIGIQTAVRSNAPSADLQPDQPLARCLDALTMFDRVDTRADWLRQTFRMVGEAPRVENGPPPRAIGDLCINADDCASGVCITAANTSVCSVACDDQPCPAGLSCEGPESARYCAPLVVETPAAPAATGCEMSGPHAGGGEAGPHTGFGALLLTLLLKARRRSRRDASWSTTSRNDRIQAYYLRRKVMPSIASWVCGVGLVLPLVASCTDEPSVSTSQVNAQGTGEGGGQTEFDAGGERDVPPLEAAVSEDPGPIPLNSCGGLIGNNACDPLSAWPCRRAEGETCDYSRRQGRFACKPPPNELAFCAPCAVDDGYCGPGGSCGPDERCVRYCCADADCSVGACQFNAVGDPATAAVGYCAEEARVVCFADAGADAG